MSHIDYKCIEARNVNKQYLLDTTRSETRRTDGRTDKTTDGHTGGQRENSIPTQTQFAGLER